MITLHRVLDWRSRLVAWAESVRGEQYAWGATDCGTLARSALEVLFGVDLFPALAWTTEREALRTLSRIGGVERALLDMGAEPCHPNFLCSGAVVVQPIPNSKLPAIFVHVDPVLVISHPTTGVEWYKKEEELLDTAIGYNLWEAGVTHG